MEGRSLPLDGKENGKVSDMEFKVPTLGNRRCPRCELQKG